MSEYRELNFFQKYRNFFILGVVFLAIVAFVGFRAYQSHAHDQKLKGALTFDPSAEEAYITPNNSIQMTLEEYGRPGILWNEGNISTVTLPIVFKDNRIPTLHLVKSTDPYRGHPGLNRYDINQGLIEGDVFVSPVDGELHVLALDSSYNKYIYGFYVTCPGTEPNTIDSTFIDCQTPLKPLVDLSQTTRADAAYLSPITVQKGQPLFEIMSSLDGKLFEPEIAIAAAGGHIAYTDVRTLPLTLDLATLEDKVILLKW
jgi:hypothetical protein